MAFDTMLLGTPEERRESRKKLLAEFREVSERNLNAQLLMLDKLNEELTQSESLDHQANTYPELIKHLREASQALVAMDEAEQELNTPELQAETLDMNATPPPRDWLIKDWLPANCLSMLTGEGGVGKSYLSLQLVATLAARGKQFHFKIGDAPAALGNPITTVWATWEDDKNEIIRRLQRIQKTLQWPNLDIIGNRFHYVDLKMLGPLWGPDLAQHVSVRGNLQEAGHQLMQICENHDAGLLVLDPCAGAFGGNENDRSAVRQFTAYLSGWAMQYNCAILLIAHPPKSNETYSGSTDWLGSVRSLWHLSKDQTEDESEEAQDDQYLLKHEKSNYAMTQNPIQLQKAEASGVWLDIDQKEAQDDNWA